MNWYFKALKNYADFIGRAQRKEYWLFALFNILIALAIATVSLMIFGKEHAQSAQLILDIYWLIILIPNLSVTVRRLHDTDRSGWWVLIGLIPFIGALVLLVFALKDSNAYDNRFGPNPKFAMA